MNIPEIIRQARKARRRDNPDCWLFMRDTAAAIIFYYDDKMSGYGKKLINMDVVLDSETLWLFDMPMHVARTKLQHEAIVYYLTDCKGLKVATLQHETIIVTEEDIPIKIAPSG